MIPAHVTASVTSLNVESNRVLFDGLRCWRNAHDGCARPRDGTLRPHPGPRPRALPRMACAPWRDACSLREHPIPMVYAPGSASAAHASAILVPRTLRPLIALLDPVPPRRRLDQRLERPDHGEARVFHPRDAGAAHRRSRRPEIEPIEQPREQQQQRQRQPPQPPWQPPQPWPWLPQQLQAQAGSRLAGGGSHLHRSLHAARWSPAARLWHTGGFPYQRSRSRGVSQHASRALSGRALPILSDQ